MGSVFQRKPRETALRSVMLHVIGVEAMHAQGPLEPDHGALNPRQQQQTKQQCQDWPGQPMHPKRRGPGHFHRHHRRDYHVANDHDRSPGRHVVSTMMAESLSARGTGVPYLQIALEHRATPTTRATPTPATQHRAPGRSFAPVVRRDDVRLVSHAATGSEPDQTKHLGTMSCGTLSPVFRAILQAPNCWRRIGRTHPFLEYSVGDEPPP